MKTQPITIDPGPPLAAIPRNGVGLSARRHWLRRMLSIGCVLFMGAVFCSVRVRTLALDLSSWLGSAEGGILDAAAMRRLGAFYLDDHPAERDLDMLARLLASDGHEPVQAALIRHIEREWRDQEIVVLDGWVHARTEARICAVLHLMHGAVA